MLDSVPAYSSSRSIAILLAVYNGREFIEDQMDSLFTQTCQDFEIFVHDDNSTDATLEIIRRYIPIFKGRLHILEDATPGRGAKGSFMWLLENVDADYYMFCDQDDMWLSEKIESTFAKMKEMEKDYDGPVMVHTDLEVVDANLNVKHSSMWEYMGFMPDLMRKFEFTCINNVFTGCTMMLNRNARDISLPMDERAPMHDWWIGLKVTKYGKVDNLKVPTILYRQHGTNVCSVGPGGGISVRLKKLFGLMDRYNRDAPMLVDLGFGRGKAVFYKGIYTLCRLFKVMKTRLLSAEG